MRLSKSEAPPALSDDDWMTCGVTHTIEVNGDQSWPKFEVGTRIRPGETPEDAFRRITQFVETKAMAWADANAKAVMNHEEKA